MQIWNFIRKVILFVFPLSILFAVPMGILYLTGENYQSLDKVLAQEKDYIIGYVYHESNYPYLKYRALEQQGAVELLVVGSSRVLQFRSHMFDCSFYNAGQTVARISDIVLYLEKNLPSGKPGTVLLGLDQWMFNPNWDDLADYPDPDNAWRPTYEQYPSISTLNAVWEDLLMGKITWKALRSSSNSPTRKVGLNASVHGLGFRPDGSMQYGNRVKRLLARDSSLDDYAYQNTLERIAQGTLRFKYADRVHEKSLEALEDLLAYCRKQGLDVVAFLPPFAVTVNERMKAMGTYGYMELIYPLAVEIFERYGYELWDMRDPRVYGSGDEETLDGFHGGELMYQKMLLHMIRHGSRLAAYSDSTQLSQGIAHPVNRYSVKGD